MPIFPIVLLSLSAALRDKCTAPVGVVNEPPGEAELNCGDSGTCDSFLRRVSRSANPMDLLKKGL